MPFDNNNHLIGIKPGHGTLRDWVNETQTVEPRTVSPRGDILAPGVPIRQCFGLYRDWVEAKGLQAEFKTDASLVRFTAEIRRKFCRTGTVTHASYIHGFVIDSNHRSGTYCGKQL